MKCIVMCIEMMTSGGYKMQEFVLTENFQNKMNSETENRCLYSRHKGRIKIMCIYTLIPLRVCVRVCSFSFMYSMLFIVCTAGFLQKYCLLSNDISEK